ncbi:hypothetical protein quinque_003040 [Culex quinquefasciatus]
MAMVVSGRAKAVIGAFICFFLLGIVLVTGSTKGWFVPVRYNHERVAARIQASMGRKRKQLVGAWQTNGTVGINRQASGAEAP